MTKMQCRCVVALAVLVVGAGEARSETRVELEAFLGGVDGVRGGGLVGLPLGQHLVLMTGLEGAGSGMGNWVWYNIRVPAELKLYLRPPQPGRLAPLLRLGGAYIRGASGQLGGSGDRFHGLECRAGAGVQLLLTTHLGLSLDAGLTYARVRPESPSAVVGLGGLGGLASVAGGDSWHLGLDWRAGLLLRL